MINIDPSNAYSPSMQQQVDSEADLAILLIEGSKKQEGKVTAKRLLELLIEYILANMGNDSDAAKAAIQGQISNVLNHFQHDIEQLNSLEEAVKGIEHSPELASPETLELLEKLISELKERSPDPLK